VDEQLSPVPADATAGGQSADALFEAVYARLKAMASRQRARVRPGATLNTTALVAEAYLKICQGREMVFAGPAQFFGYAARAMRHILMDGARARQRANRHGAPVDIDDLLSVLSDGTAEQALEIDDALRRLEQEDPRAAQLVELHYFAGLPLPEIAGLLHVTTRTLNRDWRFARAFLHDVLR
jgi:RNA polymerase sigma factor (TIGR02999 family)